MQLNDAIEGQQSGTSKPLRVDGARGERTTHDNFQGTFVHRVFIYFDWFPNSPELGNPS